MAPKDYNIDQIKILALQRALSRHLKKGDRIFTGAESLSGIQEILTQNRITFVTNDFVYAKMITINQVA